jgi:hypothetical protein
LLGGIKYINYIYSIIKNNNKMKKIKLESKLIMLNYSADVQVGHLSATLIAQVTLSDKHNNIDVDFSDIENIKFNDIEIKGYENWSKFKRMNLEYGLDYDKTLHEKFDEIFAKEAISEFKEVILYKGLVGKI